MVRFLWYMVAMGVWTLATFMPAKAMRRAGKRKAEGILFLVWFIGLGVLTALLYVAYVRGWRAPYENFKRTGG